jgi:basic amino acid/polyamine antiporter, APA family
VRPPQIVRIEITVEEASIPAKSVTERGKGALKRQLGLPLLVLYGTGITVGAGIYVLIGAVAQHAGSFAPWAFVLAAGAMGLTVGSYAELATRYPVSAGEAAYVRAAFGSRIMSTAVGLLTLATSIVASAAVTLGGSGYVRQFVELPTPLIAAAIIAVLGAVAAWGILESVLLASLFTLIEVGGLLLIIATATHSGVAFVPVLVAVPPLDAATWSGIAFAGLLAFFAFIGFEDLANVVEEAKAPRRDIPRAMALTLAITFVLYTLVAAIAVTAVPPQQLATSSAPLSLVYRTVAGISPTTFNAIAVVATLNTILAQMTMAARVVYGMARQGDLPEFAGKVHGRTGTPLVATGLVLVGVLILALAFPLERLAESTSIATLATFALVNLSLLRIRLRNVSSANPHVRVPILIPVLGFLACLAMIAGGLLG